MTRTRALIVAVVAVLALATGAYLAYDNVLRGDDVAALALPTSSPAPSSAAATTDPSASVSDGVGSDGDVAGTWSVADGSVAGYRVLEQLANLPAESEAVGRTSDVTGTLTLEAAGDGARLTAGSLTVDTTTIASDEDRRDNRLRTEGLETDRFPTATFTLTQAVDVPAAALDGTPADVALVGELTLHGVTKSVEIPAQAQLVGGTISVAGSLSFALADYEISPPNVGGFIISIADEGKLEFAVNFSKG